MATNFSFLSQIGKKGFSIIEAIVAAAVVVAAASALSVVVLVISHSREKSQLYARAMTLESGIIAAIQEPSTFESAFAAMKSGGSLGALEVKYKGQLVGRVGVPTNFDTQGASCSTLGVGRCKLQTLIDVQCTTMGSTYSVCNAAYRVRFADPKVSGFGARGTDAFAPADYNIPVPMENYFKVPQYSCNTTQEAVARGFNRDTGELNCVSYPKNKCADGTIAKSIKLINNELSLQCVPLKGVSCPPNYVLQSFTPSSLDQGQVPVGVCVFIAQTTVAWKSPPPTTPVSVSKTVCPPNYNARITSCTAQVTSTSPGNCPDYPCNCKQVCVPCVDAFGNSCGQTCTTSCDSCAPPVRFPAPSNVGAVTTSTSGQSASCSIYTGGQTCGSSWTGNVTMNGVCDLALPVTKAAN